MKSLISVLALTLATAGYAQDANEYVRATAFFKGDGIPIQEASDGAPTITPPQWEGVTVYGLRHTTSKGGSGGFILNGRTLEKSMPIYVTDRNAHLKHLAEAEGKEPEKFEYIAGLDIAGSKEAIAKVGKDPRVKALNYADPGQLNAPPPAMTYPGFRKQVQ